MEAAGIGGPLPRRGSHPRPAPARWGTLIFVGLNSWTGYGTLSLAIPDIPPFTTPTLAEFLWAIGIGLAAAVLGVAIRRFALVLQPIVERRMVLLTSLVGLAIGASAVIFGELTTHGSSQVLFSGQDALPTLIEGAAGWTVGALILLMVCKSVAYGLALSSFRGGPTFPGMFIGAAGGIALSHLPGLPMIAGAAMGIGAMCSHAWAAADLVLLTTLFLSADGLALTRSDRRGGSCLRRIGTARTGTGRCVDRGSGRRHPDHPRSTASARRRSESFLLRGLSQRRTGASTIVRPCASSSSRQASASAAVSG